MFKYRKFLICFIRGYNTGIFAFCGHRTTVHPSFFFLIGMKCFLTFIWVSNDLYTACMRAQSLQSSPFLRDSMDRSPPGSSVHEIFPSWILEWVAISFFRVSSWPRYQTCLSPALQVDFFFFNILIYFCLCWVLVSACRLSLVTVSKGYSLSQYAGLSLPWLLLLQSTGSRVCSFQSCGMWAQ